jgi:hypothetical protein
MQEHTADYFKPPPFNVAVFADSPDGGLIVLVRLDNGDEDAAAQATTRGLHYAGSISVNEGKPVVMIEADFAGVVSLAGIRWAEAFGEHLKAHQLRLRAESKG